MRYEGAEVVLKILEGLLDALAYCLVGCEMNGGGDVGVLLEDLCELGLVAAVQFHEGEGLACYLLYALQHVGG